MEETKKNICKCCGRVLEANERFCKACGMPNVDYEAVPEDDGTESIDEMKVRKYLIANKTKVEKMAKDRAEKKMKESKSKEAATAPSSSVEETDPTAFEKAIEDLMNEMGIYEDADAMEEETAPEEDKSTAPSNASKKEFTVSEALKLPKHEDCVFVKGLLKGEKLFENEISMDLIFDDSEGFFDENGEYRDFEKTEKLKEEMEKADGTEVKVEGLLTRKGLRVVTIEK